jgi:SAM-dependent methyltransferase
MDPFGNALTDYYLNNKSETLWLHNSYDVPEEMPVDIFFRSPEDMPELELIAMENCSGTILDVGAGAGSHALFLQDAGKTVTAVDISGAAADIMKNRGVKKVINDDVFTLKGQRFDTLLFLMNGIGLTGTRSGFIDFLGHAKSLLNPGGSLIFDSSDIAYLYQEGLTPTPGKYYGEVSYCYEYKKQKGAWFNWLYLDKATLEKIAKQAGWTCISIWRNWKKVVSIKYQDRIMVDKPVLILIILILDTKLS